MARRRRAYLRRHRVTGQFAQPEPQPGFFNSVSSAAAHGRRCHGIDHDLSTSKKVWSASRAQIRHERGSRPTRLTPPHRAWVRPGGDSKSCTPPRTAIYRAKRGNIPGDDHGHFAVREDCLRRPPSPVVSLFGAADSPCAIALSASTSPSTARRQASKLIGNQSRRRCSRSAQSIPGKGSARTLKRRQPGGDGSRGPDEANRAASTTPGACQGREAPARSPARASRPAFPRARFYLTLVYHADIGLPRPPP